MLYFSVVSPGRETFEDVRGMKPQVLAVLFSDIRGYTRLTKLLAPEKVTTLLDEYLGAMAAGWDVAGGQDVEQSEEGGCFYSTNGGKCYPSGNDWAGSQPAKEEGDQIGMLLDLDDRCMTVYKNGDRLGVMQSDLPLIEYCWAASLHTKGDSVRIERKSTPQ